MLKRVTGAVRLDRNTYTELVFDNSALGDAVLVVAGSGAVLAITPLILRGAFSLGGLVDILYTALFWIVGWIVYTGALYVAGTKLFKGFTQYPTVLRVTGYYWPIALVTLVPFVGWVVAVVWFAAASVVAVRSVMDLDSRNALATTLIAMAALALVGALFGSRFIF